MWIVQLALRQPRKVAREFAIFGEGDEDLAIVHIGQ